MKKESLFSASLILLTILSFSFVATSCSLFGSDNKNEVRFENNVQEKRVGILKSLGGMSVGEATHLLELDNGSTIRLRSLNTDLNSKKYLSKRVEVRGPIATTSDGKSLMDVQNIDIAEDKESTNPVTGVETPYTNAKMGVHLTYLDSWQLTEEDTRLIFTSPADNEATDSITIEKIPNPQKRTLEEFLQVPSNESSLLNSGYTQTLVGTDHLNGLKKESNDRYKLDVWLTRGDAVYQFEFTGSDHPDLAKNRNTFFSMIASFKFVGILEDNKADNGENIKPAENTSTEDRKNTLSTEEDTSKPEADTANNLATEKDSPAVITADKQESSTLTTTYNSVARYLSEQINTLAPEPSENKSWKAYSFEFTDPNYVYINYGDGVVKKRILVTYTEEGTGFNTNVEAYFNQGETTSWERVSGENPVENAKKTVITLDSENTTQPTVVKEGYRYFESLPYDFLAQYPSSWYFSGTSGSGDVLHHYGFSNEPVENGNELVSIDIVKGPLPSGSSISVGGNTGVKVYENGEVAIYIKRDDGNLYKIHGNSDQETTVIEIASTITAS